MNKNITAPLKLLPLGRARVQTQGGNSGKTMEPVIGGLYNGG